MIIIIFNPKKRTKAAARKRKVRGHNKWKVTRLPFRNPQKCPTRPGKHGSKCIFSGVWYIIKFVRSLCHKVFFFLFFVVFFLCCFFFLFFFCLFFFLFFFLFVFCGTRPPGAPAPAYSRAISHPSGVGFNGFQAETNYLVRREALWVIGGSISNESRRK